MNAGRPTGHTAIYPGCPLIERKVSIGGLTKVELLEQLRRSGVQMNQAAKILFASEQFIPSEMCSQLRTAELCIRNLGFPNGGKILDVYASAKSLGLSLCPVELGPHLRLQLQDQSEGFIGMPVYEHRAPPGSITIASNILSNDDDFPKGFYLRRIEGTLWLRGYRSGLEHIWEPDDHFVFVSGRAG